MRILMKIKTQAIVLFVSIIFSFVYLILFQNIHVGAETRHKSITSEKIASLQKRIEKLEQNERELKYEKKAMAQEISRLNKLLDRALARGSNIGKVKRIVGGRPDKRDMMVSVPGFVAVWNQIDVILDKLDEITIKLSQQHLIPTPITKR
ncbi:MAG: hypothetical protein JRJ65_07555 [Deltaproteobacteria bacterium]|nr:hypothetical protein [Deltaproteobacteria bacterium]